MEKNKKIIWGAATGLGACLLIPGAVMVSMTVISSNQVTYVREMSDIFSGDNKYLKAVQGYAGTQGSNAIFVDGGFIDTVFVKTTSDTVIDAYNDYCKNISNQVALRTAWNKTEDNASYSFKQTNFYKTLDEMNFLPLVSNGEITTQFWGYGAMTLIGGLLFIAGAGALGTAGAKKIANKSGSNKDSAKEESK